METLLSQNCLFCNKKHNNWDELITCYKSNDLDKVNWNRISCNQKLTLEFIKEFQDKINWNHISYNNCLTNDIVLEFYNNLDKDVLLERINKKELKVSQIVRNRLVLDRF